MIEHWSWIRMIIEQSIYGVIAGAIFAVLLLQYDVNGMGTMIANSEHQIGFTALIMFGFGLTFGMVAPGLAIWWRAALGDDDR